MVIMGVFVNAVNNIINYIIKEIDIRNITMTIPDNAIMIHI